MNNHRRVTFTLCDSNVLREERTLLAECESEAIDLVASANKLGFSDAKTDTVNGPLFDLWTYGEYQADEVYMYRTKSEIEGLLPDAEKTEAVKDFLSRKDPKLDRYSTSTLDLKVTKET